MRVRNFLQCKNVHGVGTYTGAGTSIDDYIMI